MSKLIKERLPGSLPSNTEVNQKKSLNGVTLRSGIQLPNPTERKPEVQIVEPTVDIDPGAPTDFEDKEKEQGKEKDVLPRYCKFLKELLTNKRKLEEVSSVTLSEECLVLIINKLPKKEKDPGVFIVPCTIGELVDEKPLAGLGARINLMPYQTFQKLGLGELKPTIMTL
ncbi:uncharacterized protein LOC120271618 [Dioscorea cayenensis subsp. rotundata]|uniref:Uncharacterized protein LOC120271618 n=1 Tax=Dioscorea cayennensis subsp. rotundata TaxID=55577 RepID=A0AB40C3A5_DIOCR|nr:uncharacterized protein LOC120271618 [Dioscorea cayenensis subsp. rotundata]